MQTVETDIITKKDRVPSIVQVVVVAIILEEVMVDQEDAEVVEVMGTVENIIKIQVMVAADMVVLIIDPMEEKASV